jgi:processive 1,2-diacylglycerol beta-glucosyltransferase
MGGGQGLGPIKVIVKSLNQIDRPLQMIAIVGTNHKIHHSLEKMPLRANKFLKVYQFANNVDELMELADIIVTKPGGMTTAESLAKGLPMVIVNPIPGQEMCNTNFLISQNIGIREDSPNKIGQTINSLLNDPQRMQKMSIAALRNAKPEAAKDIAKLIIASPSHSKTQDFKPPSFEPLEYDNCV